MINKNLIIGQSLFIFVIFLTITSSIFFPFSCIYYIGMLSGLFLAYAVYFTEKYKNEKNSNLNEESEIKEE